MLNANNLIAGLTDTMLAKLGLEFEAHDTRIRRKADKVIVALMGNSGFWYVTDWFGMPITRVHGVRVLDAIVAEALTPPAEESSNQ